MAEHTRTQIARLQVTGYRSLKAIELVDLPPIVILHGPNGAGKSNILRAVQLVLRAAQEPNSPLATREQGLELSWAEADSRLDLRPDDFAHGQLPEIRITLEIALGVRARAALAAPAGIELDRLVLSAVFQDTGSKTIRCWFDRADIDERIALSTAPANKGTPVQSLRAHMAALGLEADRSLEQEQLLAERARRALIPRLLQISGAYRSPRAGEDPSDALYDAFLSEDPREQEAARSLGRRLAAAGLFGDPATPIELLPVNAKTFGEKQIRFTHPRHGRLSLRNLGSGEQQLIFMLGQRVITPFPIAFIEEPEAHLHKSLMTLLARVLRASVAGEDGPPEVDQLWIATHHHCFALADEYFDVALDDTDATQVTQAPRDQAVQHFYEPSPYWDTLELLVQNGLARDTVVYRDPPGHAVTAGAVLDSIHGDRVIATRFVESATKAFVLSLTQEEDIDPSGT